MTEQQNQVSSAINHEEHAITLNYVEQIIEDDEEIKVDAVIVAIGISGNTENLGLEKTKVKIEKGQIKKH